MAGHPRKRRTLKKRAKPALTASCITALAVGTGTPADTILWRWPLAKVFVHLHAVAVYNGSHTRWSQADPAATAALRHALANLPEPSPLDDPYAVEDES